MTYRYFRVLLNVVLLAGLISLSTGCISTPPTADLPQAPKDITPKLTLAGTMNPYKIQIGDVLSIRMMFNPELNDDVTVQPDGMIATSVAQEIMAYGLTPKELQENLTELYSNQLTDPHLTVVVRSFAPNRVYVTGEVNVPGEFITIGPNLTLVQAIARAGGVKNSADPDEIVIIRRGAGEEPIAYQTNYKGAVTGLDASSDVRLESYDVVYVPKSGVGDAFLYFQQYFQQFVPDTFGAAVNIK